jgi:hypothetical protein
MEGSVQENRQHIRYWTAQKAIVLKEESAGLFGIISNISEGGLFLSIIGSSPVWKDDRIKIKIINHGTFLCNVVGKSRGLHCRFERNISENNENLANPNENSNVGFVQISADEIIFGNEGIGCGDLKNRSIYISKIYTDGFLTGTEQIDPAVDNVDATISVLNPYTAPEERETWTQGFKEGLQRLKKYVN